MAETETCSPATKAIKDLHIKNYSGPKTFEKLGLKIDSLELGEYPDYMAKLFVHIVNNEGYDHVPYFDSGNPPRPTIGAGFNLADANSVYATLQFRLQLAVAAGELTEGEIDALDERKLREIADVIVADVKGIEKTTDSILQTKINTIFINALTAAEVKPKTLDKLLPDRQVKLPTAEEIKNDPILSDIFVKVTADRIKTQVEIVFNDQLLKLGDETYTRDQAEALLSDGEIVNLMDAGYNVPKLVGNGASKAVSGIVDVWCSPIVRTF